MDARTDRLETLRRIDEQTVVRNDFRDTLTEVTSRIESAENRLRPARLMRDHVIGASVIAGALGLVVGLKRNNRLIGQMMVVGLFGAAIFSRSSIEPGQGSGGEKGRAH